MYNWASVCTFKHAFTGLKKILFEAAETNCEHIISILSPLKLNSFLFINTEQH